MRKRWPFQRAGIANPSHSEPFARLWPRWGARHRLRPPELAPVPRAVPQVSARTSWVACARRLRAPIATYTVEPALRSPILDLGNSRTVHPLPLRARRCEQRADPLAAVIRCTRAAAISNMRARGAEVAGDRGYRLDEDVHLLGAAHACGTGYAQRTSPYRGANVRVSLSLAADFMR